MPGNSSELSEKWNSNGDREQKRNRHLDRDENEKGHRDDEHAAISRRKKCRNSFYAQMGVAAGKSYVPPKLSKGFALCSFGLRVFFRVYISSLNTSAPRERQVIYPTAKDATGCSPVAENVPSLVRKGNRWHVRGNCELRDRTPHRTRRRLATAFLARRSDVKTQPPAGASVGRVTKCRRRVTPLRVTRSDRYGIKTHERPQCGSVPLGDTGARRAPRELNHCSEALPRYHTLIEYSEWKIWWTTSSSISHSPFHQMTYSYQRSRQRTSYPSGL
ncbi:hypothetical protein EVAR_81477_1 [Eumeta japonica]|uniref:Uncharacterized protein n=1 Tax=Eumeta variegata TaxID=151549 RepID=A0A4C1W2K3_EUMVA|nr:hypothetical protein EVAR_81477_1 [Eumeta japonica]